MKPLTRGVIEALNITAMSSAAYSCWCVAAVFPLAQTRGSGPFWKVFLWRLHVSCLLV